MEALKSLKGYQTAKKEQASSWLTANGLLNYPKPTAKELREIALASLSELDHAETLADGCVGHYAFVMDREQGSPSL